MGKVLISYNYERVLICQDDEEHLADPIVLLPLEGVLRPELCRKYQVA
jgi:hypothetical protein